MTWVGHDSPPACGLDRLRNFFVTTSNDDGPNARSHGTPPNLDNHRLATDFSQWLPRKSR
jgi:hypothetical protein